jgi:hypothetical protein
MATKFQAELEKKKIERVADKNTMVAVGEYSNYDGEYS